MSSSIDTPYRHVKMILYPERIVHLHVMPVSCGRELVTDHNYCWSGLERGNKECVIWQYCIKGEGGVDIDGESYRMRAGEGMLLIVPENHCYYLPKESSSWEFVWINFVGREAVRLARECRLRGGAVHRLGAESNTIRCANNFLDKYLGDGAIDVWQGSALSYQFLLNLTAEYSAHSRGHSRLDFMRKINEYCMEHIAQGITVDELAKRAGYSRWHFSRIFREYNGVSPIKYIVELKMRRAAQLLQNTKYPIKEVAAQCGFDDSGYFCNVFRKVHGVSPQKFRIPRIG